VISNPFQRKDNGGQPALVIKKNRYVVQNLTQSEKNIPWAVEIVRAVLTPLNITQKSSIKKIMLALSTVNLAVENKQLSLIIYQKCTKL
jgi:hypothetical protein